jgi:3-hydroxyacyl-CoA dehydrogenase
MTTANQEAAPRAIGVVGAGQMGGGIAQVAADKGHKVVLVDINQAVADKGKAKIAASLDKLVAKGKIAGEARDGLLSRIAPAGEYAALASCDFVV